ncbi:MAG: hypothetical protein Ct9H300mP14_01820 [Gammaproteobacteria bacterium]|nr:MAG: hypothetical protein Ct9H300mP14_01820 [Gammaproteobacteria bacterium]
MRQPLDAITGSLPADGDQLLDTLILRAKTLLGKERFTQIHDLAGDTLVDDIRKDLSQFRVNFDHWFSENTLVTGNAVARAVEKLTGNGLMYEKDGPLWLRTTDYGDEKDRVVIRANGNHTYFATDIAYHLDKFERGFDMPSISGVRIIRLYQAGQGFDRRIRPRPRCAHSITGAIRCTVPER